MISYEPFYRTLKTLDTLCFILDCRVEDVLEYEKPAESAP